MKNKQQRGLMIASGHSALGIEFGSSRIKALLVGENHELLASGAYEWENRLEDGIWTYPLEAVWTGLQAVYAEIARSVKAEYGISLLRIGSIGISAMMHGYLPFDAAGQQLAPFRTWRNTITGEAAAALTERFQCNIPQRWSIAHLYQAILNGEAHAANIAYLTTLAGYVHWRLTGEKTQGVGDASGVFPIDSRNQDFDADLLESFDALIAGKGFTWKTRDILPKVLCAGEMAGRLTDEGARLLDPSGRLEPGISFCPPEGDAGTGMVATNAVAKRTGNVSAGTSIFAMIVLERPLGQIHKEIDTVTTPSAKPVAMVHCNNCTSDLDAWVRLFGQVVSALGMKCTKTELYSAVYNAAMSGAPDADGLLSVNYCSGEHITGFTEGRPLFVRMPDSEISLASFARALIYSAMATLRIGMDILTKQEQVQVDMMRGHGGLFKIPQVGQSLMAGALNIPVSVMESAGEGGAWGMALLAAYMRQKAEHESLEDYLAGRVFRDAPSETAMPNTDDAAGFERYLERFKDGLAIERAAIQNLS